jgi:hypothetical protein
MADPTSTSSAVPTATPTDTGKNSNTPGNSPLLFFVALGFGVVFTNLWYDFTAFTAVSLHALTYIA